MVRGLLDSAEVIPFAATTFILPVPALLPRPTGEYYFHDHNIHHEQKKGLLLLFVYLSSRNLIYIVRPILLKNHYLLQPDLRLL
jgi:hypothetical protein